MSDELIVVGPMIGATLVLAVQRAHLFFDCQLLCTSFIVQAIFVQYETSLGLKPKLVFKIKKKRDFVLKTNYKCGHLICQKKLSSYLILNERVTIANGHRLVIVGVQAKGPHSTLNLSIKFFEMM